MWCVCVFVCVRVCVCVCVCVCMYVCVCMCMCMRVYDICYDFAILMICCCFVGHIGYDVSFLVSYHAMHTSRGVTMIIEGTNQHT